MIMREVSNQTKQKGHPIDSFNISKSYFEAFKSSKDFLIFQSSFSIFTFFFLLCSLYGFPSTFQWLETDAV